MKVTTINLNKNIHIGLSFKGMDRWSETFLEHNDNNNDKKEIDMDFYLNTLLGSNFSKGRTVPHIRWAYVIGEEMSHFHIEATRKKQNDVATKEFSEQYFKRDFWLPDDTSQQKKNSVLLVNTSHGTQPIVIDYSFHADLQDYKNAILKLIVLSQIEPICVQCKFDPELVEPYTRITMEIGFITSIISDWLNNNFTSSSKDLFKEKIYAYIKICRKNMADDFDPIFKIIESEKNIDFLFLLSQEIWWELLGNLANQDLDNRIDEKLASKLRAVNINIQKYIKETKDKHYKKEKFTDTTVGRKTLPPSPKIESLEKATNLFPASINNAHLTISVGDLLKLHLILLAVRNFPWMYVNRKKKVSEGLLKAGSFFKSKTAWGTNAARDTIKPTLEIIDKYLKIERPLLGLAKFLISYRKECADNAKNGWRSRDVIYRDVAKNNVFMLGMIPIVNKRVHERQAIIQEFKQIGCPLKLIVSVVRNFELEGRPLLNCRTVRSDEWKSSDVDQIQIPLLDGINSFDKITEKKRKAILVAIEKIYDIYKQKNCGIYFHCKAGKGRSLTLAWLTYALFCTNDPKLTIEKRIHNAYFSAGPDEEGKKRSLKEIRP